ncbi:Glycosyl transferase family 2 [Anaerovirgula multivorans]|uniref:Glycosyl transferase family 2 n=1 Tax=Anaerovirgula multivorans TaxID=312168 RepID=A0A239EG31_9FIRM|nr:glycosyltransferase [Anaerovirgula multivorans]SNS43509.1 Glycosyl transferase family 2 [Anaerovirgula multivorans]
MENEILFNDEFLIHGITVGIPFYKNSKKNELKLAIDSILNQTLLPYEIHLIQDGPVTKEIEEVVRYYVNTLKEVKIKHILIPQNVGLAQALNISILATNTCYYARMDADDISHPERFKKQYDFLEVNRNVHILGTWEVLFQDELNYTKGFLKKVPTTEKEIHNFFHYRSPFVHASVMFRTIIFSKIGLYNISTKKIEDYELWARVLKNKVGVANIPETLYFMRYTEAMERRFGFDAFLKRLKIQYSYNTPSPKLNLLKIASLVFFLLPNSIKRWGYNNLRG